MAVAVNGRTRLHWRAEGSGEPMLFIMGLSLSSRAWFRVLPHVAPHATCLLFDNRGTGDSDPVRGRITMDDLVGDALAVLDAAGVESAHVHGVSMGGMIAQRLALDHRGRVRSLLLGCTTARAAGGAPPWRLLATSALRPALGVERLWPLMAPALYAPATLRDHRERVREDLDVRMHKPTDARTSWAQLVAIAGHDLRGRLHELAGLPTTVVHGTEDVLVPTERGRELAALIPGAHLELVEGAGHIMSTDAEEATARAVLGHLRRAALAGSDALPA